MRGIRVQAGANLRQPSGQAWARAADSESARG